MSCLSELLAAGTQALLDGGMGTLLQERGLEGGAAGELWNVDRPSEVRLIHEEYADAGATVLTTNTFGGTRCRLDMHGLGDRVGELNLAAAELARDVADARGVLVGGGLGPTGELFAPLGGLTAEAAEEIFEEQLRGLVAGGIDLVLIETMSDLAEARAAVVAAQAAVPGTPVVVTLSFDTNLRTMMGVSPEEAVRELAAAGVDAVGANCGRGPTEMEQIAEQLVASRTDGILIAAQSNAGLPHPVGDRFEYDIPPAGMAAHAVRLRQLGVDLIGACCGSTPQHVAAMRDALAA